MCSSECCTRFGSGGRGRVRFCGFRNAALLFVSIARFRRHRRRLVIPSLIETLLTPELPPPWLCLMHQVGDVLRDDAAQEVDERRRRRRQRRQRESLDARGGRGRPTRSAPLGPRRAPCLALQVFVCVCV